MKPISLVIDGINSFCDRQEIDFRFDGLFCICGDTGSGKTTILDCIIIALFGTGNRATTLNDYINLRRDKAEIRFVFETELGGKRQNLEVARYLSRTSGTKARLVNLTTGQTLAEQTVSVNNALKDIIGLSINDFTQMVILEQGKFAKFLTAGKKDRNETVGNLFKLNKYKDLGSKFSVQMKDVKRDIESVDERLDELKDVTNAALTAKEKEFSLGKKKIDELSVIEEQLSTRISELNEIKSLFDKCVIAENKLLTERQRLKQAIERFDAANIEVEQASLRLKEAELQKAESERAATRICDLQKVIAELDERNKAIHALATEWKAVAESEKKLAIELDELVEKERNYRVALGDNVDKMRLIAHIGEKDGYCDVFDAKSQADKLKLDYENATNELARVQKNVDYYGNKAKNEAASLLVINRKIKVKQDEIDQVKKEEQELSKKRDETARACSAALIRNELNEGDICPVCGGTVREKSDVIVVNEYNEPLRLKQAKLEKLQVEYAEIDNNKYSFATRLEETNKLLTVAQEELNDAKARIKKLSEFVVVPEKIDELCELALKNCDIERKLTNLQSEIKVCSQRLESAKQKAFDIKERGAAERVGANKLTEIINGSFVGDIDVQKEKAGQLDNLTQLVDQLSQRLKVSQENRLAIAAEHAAAEANVKLLAEEVSARPMFDLGELVKKQNELSAIKAERERLIMFVSVSEKEIQSMREDLDRKRAFEKLKSDKKKKYDIYSDIYKLVSGDKFIEYVAEEYILQFTSLASVVLSDMTGGKYTLLYSGGAFYVKDFLSDGLERKASTLSGGETFLASLSLAIAISREIARYKTYEFFFLDEGFGTLDAYSIDMVISALTTLSKDTLVGVVTHRSELTDRIFDKLTVTSAGVDKGSIVTRSD